MALRAMQADPVTEQLPVTGSLAALAQPGTGAAYLGLPISLAGVAVAAGTAFLVGAWCGIVPFVGPRFGFAPPGTPAGRWALANAVLNAVPGGVAVLAAVLMALSLLRVRVGGGRAPLVLAGAVAAVTGAWMVVGPWALPLISNISPTSLSTNGTSLAAFGRLVGCHLGPGVVLVAAGAAAAVLGNQHKTVRFAVVGHR